MFFLSCQQKQSCYFSENDLLDPVRGKTEISLVEHNAIQVLQHNLIHKLIHLLWRYMKGLEEQLSLQPTFEHL